MISLKRPECPQKLTVRKLELTKEYKATGKAVWKKKFITEPLIEMSYGKCAFCECKLGEEGKYMQVEHFHHKAEYADEVVDWLNLLPICIRCNSHKREHDTYERKIIDPSKINPQDYLSFSKYRYTGKNEIGDLTIEVLDLNNTTEIATPRFQVGNFALDKLKDIIDLLRKFEPYKDDLHEQAKIRRKVKALLNSGTEKYEYCATVSTVILNSPSYPELKRFLIYYKLWSEEFQKIEDKLQRYKLDIEGHIYS
ncbi:HNH endonuclease [Paenibacillus taichungensis]